MLRKKKKHLRKRSRLSRKVRQSMSVFYTGITRLLGNIFYYSESNLLRRVTAGITAVVIIMVCLGYAINTRVAYAVFVNGEVVSATLTRTEAELAVESAEQRLTEILGESAPLAKDISVSLSIAPSVATSAETESAIISKVENVTEAYAIIAFGEIIGASDDAEELRSILNRVINSYETKDTVYIALSDEVTIEKTFVADNVTRNVEVIYEALAELGIVDKTERLRTTVNIPFETVEIEDETMFKGETVVIKEGVYGVREIVEKVTYLNGVEMNRESHAGALTALPVSQVVVIGTNERSRTASYGEYICPVDETAVITSYFGPRTTNSVGSSNHKGIDYAGYLGQDIYASDGGVVVYAGVKTGFGKVVQIEHDNGDVTYYAHCDSLVVKSGDSVARSDVIAKMGSSGVSSGVHCHFEIRPGGGQPVNPLKYLNK